MSQGIYGPEIEGAVCFISDCWFFKCNTGDFAGIPSVYVASAEFCQVTTPMSEYVSYNYYQCTYCSVDRNGNEIPDSWEMNHFASLSEPAEGNYDGDEHTNAQEYNDGTDPNTIRFFPNFGNYYINSTTTHGTIELDAGVPSQIAVLINSDDFGSATWQTYNGPNFTFNIGPSDGVYTVYVGLRGRSTDSVQTWESETITLDRGAPAVIITATTPGTTSQPILQLVGYSPEKLRSISFDISNSSGLLANREGNVTDQIIDPTTGQFTINWFACRDIRLATGVNTITLRTTDMAGNMSTHIYNYTLDYSGDTTSPVLTLEWPENGNNVSGNSFTLRGRLDDPTATVSAQITDSSGNTSTVAGIVERDGLLWVENLPLETGANTLILTMQDAAGNTSSSTNTVNKSTVNLTIDPIGDPNQFTATITGKINVNDHKVWVNGLVATLTEDGMGGWNWQADDVNMGTGGTAVVQATAIPNADNGGNGSGGGGAGGTGAPTNPSSPNSPSSAQTPERSEVYYVQKYKIDYKQRRRWTDLYCYECFFSGDDKWWSNLEWTSAYTLGPSGGSSGTHKSGYRYDAWRPDGTLESSSCGETILTCPRDYYVMPNIGPLRPGPITTTSCSSPSSTGTGNLWAFLWEIWDEHKKDDWLDPEDGSSWMTDYDRTARMTVELKTGGKSGSSKENIFGLLASALNHKRINTYTGEWQTEGVTPTSIQVCGKTLGSDSVVYKKLPDNDDVDITPIAPPKRYKFAVHAVKYRMTPKVKCAAAADPNPERTNLGVGEEDTISGMPTETHWSISGGGTLSPPGPGPAKDLTAPGVAGNVTVTATVRDESATIDFSIHEPSGVKATVRGQADLYQPLPQVGAGMQLDVVLQPTTVSFSRLQVIEPVAAATGKIGFFNLNGAPAHSTGTGAGIWHPVACDNKILSPPQNFFDHCYDSWNWPVGASGAYTWPISPLWRVIGSSVTPPLNGWTDQVFTLSSDGTMRIDKFGHHVVRGRNEPRGTVQ